MLILHVHPLDGPLGLALFHIILCMHNVNLMVDLKTQDQDRSVILLSSSFFLFSLIIFLCILFFFSVKLGNQYTLTFLTFC